MREAIVRDVGILREVDELDVQARRSYHVTLPILPLLLFTGPDMGGLEATKSKADDLADKDVDSTETELRYAAYGARLRTALRASHRYFAYVLSSLLLFATTTELPSDQ